MSHDDDMLQDYDLSAWDVPPPPAELADLVIDRMGGTDVGIAVPMEEREPRRVWIIAGVAVAVVVLAIGVWSLIRSTRPAAPASGGVFAEHARSLSLDNVHADLDIGADVRWKRQGDVLFVEQRAGNAAWHIDSGEKLVIDAGASLASVEATGANLRVEVQMNAMDARVIGASALTAAAVAMVTVVVYEGHVKVGRGGQQTVVVNPGSTYQVKAEEGEPPVVGATVPDNADTIVIGSKVAILGLELVRPPTGDEPVVAQVLTASMRAAAKKAGPYDLAPGSDRELVDEKLMNNCANEDTACMAAIGANFAADGLIWGRIEHQKDGYQVTAKLLDVAKKHVVRSTVQFMPDAEAKGAGLDRWAKKVYMALVDVCDAEALRDEGLQKVNIGQHAAALTQFEASLKCTSDPYVLQLAFMESCSSGNSPKAKLYYKQLPAAQQQRFAQICIRQKTAYEDDADAPKKDTLDRTDIAAVIQKARATIDACGEEAPEGGNVKVNIEVNATGKVMKVTTTSAPGPEVAICVASALDDLTFPASKKGAKFSYPFVFAKNASACDADKLKNQGLANVNTGQHAAALVKFEASLRCKQDAFVVQLAFMESCTSGNAVKARLYYKQLAKDAQEKFAQICVRNKTAYEDSPTVTPPANCDAEALKEEGIQNVNIGQHAAALSRFEASLRCKRDPYVLQLVFMEACSSGNSAKAKLYYKQLPPPQQQKFAQVCKRQKVAYDDTPVVDDEVGYLQVFAKPVAKVFIDGKDTGLKTPISGQALKLAPGKHKITFDTGADRFTYSVVIKAGETETMSKDLQ